MVGHKNKHKAKMQAAGIWVKTQMKKSDPSHDNNSLTTQAMITIV